MSDQVGLALASGKYRGQVVFIDSATVTDLSNIPSEWWASLHRAVSAFVRGPHGVMGVGLPMGGEVWMSKLVGGVVLVEAAEGVLAANEVKLAIPSEALCHLLGLRGV